MSDVKITDLTNYTGPDRTQDVLPIVNISGNQTQKITINSMLGITGSPIGSSDSQTLSNKILANTNTITVKDATNLTIQNASDITKQARFSLAALTTGNTRTYTMPDVTDTLVSLTATQTLTNKTLTSPTINTASINNATITADALSGYSSANTGTVYGMAITSGTIGPTALSTGVITLGFAQITTTFTGTATSFSSVTGLSTTVTIPTGGRRVRVTVVGGAMASSSSAGTVISMDIYDSTAASELGGLSVSNPVTNYNMNPNFIATHVPTAGSRTYQVRYTQSASGTFSIPASSTNPAFILVELI